MVTPAFPLSERHLRILRLLAESEPRPRWNGQATWAARRGATLKDLASLKRAGLLAKLTSNHGCTTSLGVTEAGYNALEQASHDAQDAGEGR